ncbi:uncharacterized protein LOC131604316 [Vicia villosa]|uniref:uncharacterized protein LOC131604316 n=1 Tax=Vicia villosa TaxID=3911 RepID=UPI00273C3519|nr:uncharacterized protein LOC131604316 [Vicia villosa]
MSNNEGNFGYGRELAYLLRDNINNKVQDFRSRCCDKIRANAEIIPTEELTGHGKRSTTTVIDTKIFSFSFPKDSNVTYFSNIDNMLSNLKHWKVQCRKRNSGICDTYYIHDVINDGKKLRSVTEVVNRLLPEGYAKLESRKRKGKDDEVDGEDNKVEIEAKDENSPKVISDYLLLPNAFVSRKKRKYKKRVKKEKHAPKEKNIAPSSLDSSKFSPKIEDQVNNSEVENICGSLVIKVKGINPQFENICYTPEIEVKAKNLESEVKFCPLMSEHKKLSSDKVYNEDNNFEIEAKDVDNLKVRSDDLLFPSTYVPRKNRSYKKRVQKEKQAEKETNISLRSQISSTFPPKIEDKVSNSKTENVSCHLLVKFKYNYEVLSEITEDFSEYDDLIESFF